MIVALVTASGKPADTYFVLTVWPRAKKPRPSAAAVPLVLVKTFRACLLRQRDDAAASFEPTDCCGHFHPDTVFAILDCSEVNHSEGRVVISEESLLALERLKRTQHHVPEASSGKSRKRKREKSNKEENPEKSDKTAGANLKKGVKAAQKMAEKAKALQKHPIKLVASDIRKSHTGRKCIRNFVEQIMQREAVICAGHATFDSDGFCTLKEMHSLSDKAFLSSIATFFERRYFMAKPAVYSDKVFSDLMGIWKDLNSDPPLRKKWHALLHDFQKSGGAETLQC